MSFCVELEALLRSGLGRAFPMASAWVALEGRYVGEAHVGGAKSGTLWDLASLTKPMATAQVAMEAVSRGDVALSERISEDLPAWVTVENLLGHRAGLPAWKDLVQALPPPRLAGSSEARYAVDALVRIAAREGDPGRGAEYSDLGFILLGRYLEARLGAGLDSLVGGYRPGRGTFAGTGRCPWRQRELLGEVHDPNAWVMGGVAGHAGQFLTVAEVGDWALGLERRARGETTGHVRADAIDPGVLRDFWDPGRKAKSWVLGWDTPSGEASAAGRNASPGTVGHLGFTGTSVWIDRDVRLVVVLLTNRVALGPEAQPRLKAFRTWFQDAVRELASSPYLP